MDDRPTRGSLEYPSEQANNDAFPSLDTAKPMKAWRCANTKACKAATAVVNATVPGYTAPPTVPNPNNGTIPLASHIALTWVRTTMADMVQHQQANQGFHTVATKVQNRTLSGSLKNGSTPPSGVTDITVICFGSSANVEEEAQFCKCHPSVIVEAAQRGLNLHTKFPPTLLKGCWLTTTEKTGNFIYTISGDITPAMLDSLHDCLCEPFPGHSTIVLASGWTWAQLCRVPNTDSAGVIYLPFSLPTPASRMYCSPSHLDGWATLPISKTHGQMSFSHTSRRTKQSHIT